jgi:hypothetical protein
MTDWTPAIAYEPGDEVTFEMPRSWSAIWRDRILGLRWDVPLTEKARFACAAGNFDMRPGAVNYAHSWTPVDDRAQP